jgi:hypothetical protein
MEEIDSTAVPFARPPGVATAVGVVEAAHADLTKEQRDQMTADEIFKEMKAGTNASGQASRSIGIRWAKLRRLRRGSIPLIVFSCVDSRGRR